MVSFKDLLLVWCGYVPELNSRRYFCVSLCTFWLCVFVGGQDSKYAAWVRWRGKCRWVLHHLKLGSAVIKCPVSRVGKCRWVLHHLTLGFAIEGQVSSPGWMRKCGCSNI